MPNLRLFLMLILICVLNLFACGSGDNNPSTDTDSDTDTDTDTDSDTDADSDSDTSFSDDHFNINVSFSPEISTVAIVTWSTDYESFDSAEIEFGLDSNYGLAAPVDLSEPDFRTLLLGMKPSRDYHFRIVINDGDTTHTSDDFSITTGLVPNGLPIVTLNTVNSSALQGGYTVFAFYEDCRIIIMDADGEYVWWHSPDIIRCSRARMSYDGKHMLFRNVNVGAEETDPTAGKIFRVSMDGLNEESVHIGTGHHDLTVLPDGTIGLIAYDGEYCDDILEVDPLGNITTVFHLADAVTPELIWSGCHSNSLHYWPEEDAYTVSVLTVNSIVKFTRDGTLLWVLGGDENDFSGDFIWNRQHGHHIKDGDILFFNNGGEPTENSRALIYTIDEKNLVATPVWEYTGGENSLTFGDVQYLPNGNILVTYSNAGVIHEVEPDGELVQSMYWNLGSAISYTMRRDSLYGPPPK